METAPSKADSTLWTLNRSLLVAGWLSLLMSGLVFEGLGLFADPFAYIFLLPGLVFLALAAWRRWPWAHLVAGILISLPAFIILLVFGAINSLAEPIRGNDFISSTFSLLVPLFALPGGIAGFVAGRKGQAQPGLRSAWRTRIGAYASVLALLALGAIITSLLAAASASDLVSGGYDFTPGASLSLATEDTKFSLTDFTIKAGTITEIQVENKDPFYHTFTYTLDGKTYSHDLLAGKTAKFLVLVDKPQAIKFICKPHEANGMVGTFTVQ